MSSSARGRSRVSNYRRWRLQPSSHSRGARCTSGTRHLVFVVLVPLSGYCCPSGFAQLPRAHCYRLLHRVPRPLGGLPQPVPRVPYNYRTGSPHPPGFFVQQSSEGGVDGGRRRGARAGAVGPLNTSENCWAMGAAAAAPLAVQADSSAAEAAPSITAVDAVVAEQADSRSG